MSGQQTLSFDPQQLKPPASTTAEKDKCTVSGRVSNIQSGEPLKKVNLRPIRHGGSGNASQAWEGTGYGGVSEQDGSFRFESVEPGDYSLLGERAGFLSTSYGSKNGVSPGTRLSLTAVKLQLVPQGVISGRVVDEDGEPAGGVSVSALGSVWGKGGSLATFLWVKPAPMTQEPIAFPISCRADITLWRRV